MPLSNDEAFARPMVSGRHGMVTSLSPLASMAGLRILLKGGNAFDAAVATALAVTVVDPKNSTIGGQGFAAIYVARDRRVRTLNYYGKAPAGATLEALKDRFYKTGYLAAPVPGTLKGLEALHRAYGKMPWRDVVGPAIELAENGFVLSEDFTVVLARLVDRLDFPSSRRVFFPDGRLPRVGEIFRQPDLARTLRQIADHGADAFYKGAMARKIADFYQANGGILSYDDLAGYEAKWVEPISTNYRGYTVYTPPPNSSGIALLLQLNLLEGYDLGKFQHNSPDYLHLIGEVQRVAIADRNRYVADPEFVPVPVARLLGKDYADERRKLISLDHTMPSAVPASTSLDAPEKSNTTHLTVVDEEGNMASLTQTLGSWFGNGVVAADTGVLFSNQLRHLHTDPASPSRIGPGRQPRSNQSPLIVLKDGRPFLAIGTPGNDGIWQRMVQVLVNIVDFHMDLQHAVAAPRMIYGGFQETGTDLPPVFAAEDKLPAETLAGLRARGYTLHLIPSDEGSVNGVMRDPATGFMVAGADPRRWGIDGGIMGDWAGNAVSVYAVGW
ncbi:MAG: gamma-glutamyltransferase [Verrucomicrobia bacterium]|nr:gamma-glutamyltransferase [Verrucomicrobiota bacterium]